jgi:hypothetical protein
MNKEEAIEAIIRLCDDEKGFLVQLRSLRTFHQDKYNELVTAIRVYLKAIAGDQTIDRRVASSLHSLERTLEYMATVFPRNEEEQRLIENAVAECWELVEEVFTPEWYKVQTFPD